MRQRTILECMQWLCTKIQIWPQKNLSELRIMLLLVGTYVRECCPPFLCLPFCTPFHMEVSRRRNVEFLPFLSFSLMFMGTQGALPPLFAPLFSYLESSNDNLKIMYVSFFLKMLCFRCTNAFSKNELVLLLCRDNFPQTIIADNELNLYILLQSNCMFSFL